MAVGKIDFCSIGTDTNWAFDQPKMDILRQVHVHKLFLFFIFFIKTLIIWKTNRSFKEMQHLKMKYSVSEQMLCVCTRIYLYFQCCIGPADCFDNARWGHIRKLFCLSSCSRPHWGFQVRICFPRWTAMKCSQMNNTSKTWIDRDRHASFFCFLLQWRHNNV